MPSASTIRFDDAHQLGIVERDEVHREAGAHRLARLRMPEHDLAAVAMPSIVRSPPVASSITSRSAPRLRQQLDRLLEPHRDGAGPLVEQLVRAVDGRVEDAKAARAGREHRLEADGAVGVAELARGRFDLGGAGDAAELGRGDAELGAAARTSAPCRSSARSRRAARRAPASGTARRAPRALRGRTTTAAGSRRRLRAPRSSSIASGNAGVGAAGDDVERVAEVAADRALAHVGADEAHLALAVRAQRMQQRGRARRARRGDHDGDRLHERSILSFRRCSRRAARSLSRNDSIDSRIVAPSYAQISGCVSSCSHSKSPCGELLVRDSRCASAGSSPSDSARGRRTAPPSR